MAEGIVEITDGGRVVYANSAALDLCGGSEKDLLGTSFLDRFTPEARQKISAVIHGQKRQGESERTAIPIDLDGRWVEIHTLRVGEIRSASTIVIMHDVTRAKRTEAALRTANAKLARQARELKASNDKLRQASEEKVRLEGQLIYRKATRYLA